MTNPTSPLGSSADNPLHPLTNPPCTHAPRTGLSPTGKFILGLGAVIFLACSAKAPETTTTPGPGPEANTPAAPADAGPGASEDSPAPVGTPVSPAKGWTIKVDAPTKDATADIIKANQFNKPDVPTNKLFAVPVTVTNGSGKPGAPFTDLKIGALPPNGVRAETKFAVAGYPVFNSMAQLQPGASVSGNMVFELDPSTIGQTVLLAEPQFTLDENEDQRFLALQ